jgi:YD repeat-containing protein
MLRENEFCLGFPVHVRSEGGSVMSMHTRLLPCAGGVIFVLLVASVSAQVVEPGDVVLGLDDPNAADTLELIRAGVAVPDPWNTPLIQSVEFDNLDGVPHNPQGNLLGLEFGTLANGGQIFSFATCSPNPQGQLIGDTQGFPGVSLTRLSGLSVSPNNAYVAVAGYDTGTVIVFDYVPGDCNGGGAMLLNGRETPPNVLCVQDSQGTAFLDDNTVLAFSSQGDLIAVDVHTMQPQIVGQAFGQCGPSFTDIEYSPAVDPDHIFVSYGEFTGVSVTQLFVFSAQDFSLLRSLDYSVSMDTAREIALDAAGSLLVSQVGGMVDAIPNAPDVPSLMDNVSDDYYASSVFSSFPGLDAALDGGPPNFVEPNLEPGTKHQPRIIPHVSDCDVCPDGDPEGEWADPVYLFNGEFYYEHTDLLIKGRGFDFVWARKYRSREGDVTPMGINWDFSYNVRLAPAGSDLVLHNGQSRRDLFELQEDGTWTRPEFFHVIELNPDDDSLVLTFQDTSQWIFNAIDGSPAQGKLNTIVDRNSNSMAFEYDGLGRLTVIGDTLSQLSNPREISIAYNADGLISSVTDFTGRVVTYDYYDGIEPGGNLGDLKSVTTPAVVGTPHGNDFPERQDHDLHLYDRLRG